MKYVVNLTVFVAIHVLYANGQTYSAADQLYTDLLSGYNKHVRPLLNQADLLQVHIFYDIGSILDLDEVEGIISLYLSFQYSWTDELIMWNPVNYNNTMSVSLPGDSVWQPELVLANPASSVTSLSSSMTHIRYYPDGTAIWFPSGVISAGCDINIKYYPFDKQNCQLTFSISNYFSTEMVLNALNEEAPLAYFWENGEWELVKTKAAVTDKGINVFTVTVTLARRPAFVIIIVIVPIMLLSILNILVFLLPVDSGERMSFTITLLLSLAVFLTIISDNIPKTSSPLSILCYFIGLQMLLSTIICIVTILNLRLYHKDDSELVPDWFCLCFRRHKNHQTDEIKSTGSQVKGSNEVHTIPSSKADGVKSSSKVNLMNIKDWKGFKQSEVEDRSAQRIPLTWKDISRYVDWIMLLTSSIYFILVFIIFAFLIVFRDGSEDQ